LSGQQGRRVYVILGLYRPDLQLLSRQLRSIEAQSHDDVEVFVAADGPAGADIHAAFAAFSRPLHLLEHDARVGVHANFARGLRAALAASRSEHDLFAFCDQDDVWHSEKLAKQVLAFADPRTSLCHSDARIVSRGGELLQSSLFAYEGRPHSASFTDLLVMNSVTGMTALFRRDVATAAASFPLSRCRHMLHDHWVALVASLLGDIRLIDEPLVDYTQHRANVMGARRSAGNLHPKRSRRTYLRKCYREFFWRRRALRELRGKLPDDAAARERMFDQRVVTLFDCREGPDLGGLLLSLDRRLRGEGKRADQIWRLWRGKTLACHRPRSAHASARHKGGSP
jgi:glycosyltransferase involved in cell wall biosynthesis